VEWVGKQREIHRGFGGEIWSNETTYKPGQRWGDNITVDLKENRMGDSGLS